MPNCSQTDLLQKMYLNVLANQQSDLSESIRNQLSGPIRPPAGYYHNTVSFFQEPVKPEPRRWAINNDLWWTLEIWGMIFIAVKLVLMVL